MTKNKSIAKTYGASGRKATAAVMAFIAGCCNENSIDIALILLWPACLRPGNLRRNVCRKERHKEAIAKIPGASQGSHRQDTRRRKDRM
jgi:hypothetical protein